MPDRRGSFPVAQPHPQRPFGSDSANTLAGAGVKRLTSILKARFRRRGTAPVPEAKGKATSVPIPVLLASARQSDRAAFRDLLAGARYFAVPSEDLDQASRLIRHIVFPILVCDASFDGGDGLISSACLIGMARVPALVLLCDPCESEPAKKAFEVLVRPFDAGTLLPMLDAAHRNFERAS